MICRRILAVTVLSMLALAFVGVSGGQEPVVGIQDLGWYVLRDGEPSCGVLDDSLQVAHDHVDHGELIAVELEVILQGDRGRRADDVHLGPQLPAGGVGATLHVGRAHQHDGCDCDASFGQYSP